MTESNNASDSKNITKILERDSAQTSNHRPIVPLIPSIVPLEALTATIT